ncbi:MAG: TlpA disulfide reductase family protein [Flavobacteriales bacterium]
MRSASLTTLLIIAIASCSNVGNELPDFHLKTLEGDELTKENLHGKVTVIDVWATWCHNCANERESLNRLVESYQGNPKVVFLGFADEDPEIVSAFLERMPFKFTPIPAAADFTSELKTRLVKTYPQHIILDQNLKIQYEHTGELSNPEETLSTEIDALLTPKNPEKH